MPVHLHCLENKGLIIRIFTALAIGRHQTHYPLSQHGSAVLLRKGLFQSTETELINARQDRGLHVESFIRLSTGVNETLKSTICKTWVWPE